MTDDLSNQAIAFHEAGHAVACIVKDVGVDSVTIKPGADSYGSCIHPSVMGFEFTNVPERRRIARDCIIIAFSGVPAERLISPDAPDTHGSGDEENANWLSREFHVFPRRMQNVGDEYHEEYLDRLRNEARRLVKRERRAIEAVARELLAKTTINGQRVESIVQKIRSSC